MRSADLPLRKKLYAVVAVVTDVAIGLLEARVAHVAALWLLSWPALEMGRWLAMYMCQDLLFYMVHFHYHQPGRGAWRLLSHLLLPFHATHHGPQSAATYFSNVVLESWVMFSVCSAAAFAVAGVHGVLSSVVQQINTNYLVHILAHVFSSVHHQRHHARPHAANFGSECSFFDICGGTYFGKTMVFNLQLLDSVQVAS